MKVQNNLIYRGRNKKMLFSISEKQLIAKGLNQNVFSLSGNLLHELNSYFNLSLKCYYLKNGLLSALLDTRCQGNKAVGS